eukprot:6100699-Pleurochrysis_carterae.AAC.1
MASIAASCAAEAGSRWLSSSTTCSFRHHSPTSFKKGGVRYRQLEGRGLCSETKSLRMTWHFSTEIAISIEAPLTALALLFSRTLAAITPCFIHIRSAPSRPARSRSHAWCARVYEIWPWKAFRHMRTTCTSARVSSRAG